MSTKENSYVPTSDSKDDELTPYEDEDEDEETVDVNGFQILVSQEKQVKEMFEKRQELTSNFNFKNQQIKNVFMEVLLYLIETLSKSTTELSMEVLNEAESTLFDLIRAGLNVGWLRQKWEEAYLKKEKQRVSGARIRELEEQVKKRKLTLSDLESDLKKEKAAALAAKSRTGLIDVVRRS
ncbi:PREDICTED: MATH domain and coiled-coil domain-containing protein At3g58280-like [Camelina sativa]|uniref:MATH domain and coiled-coil domain-containing protein At3g58280-like n=1 Tax=Camelina sativa TaxID=90675 RepID=A0ABM1QFS2_CAMSA|nr:PREDICTED: MATH domain and coiled-coil domain-containing protein At3g58280-like [Camelina sativa]